jgi:hypothetical protein
MLPTAARIRGLGLTVADHGNNIRTDVDIYRRDTARSLHKAKLRVQLTRTERRPYSVPGALLRCGIKYYLPDLDNLKPARIRTSNTGRLGDFEVDDKPEPSK